MVSNMVTTWQERMLDCVGLPKDVVAPAETINVAIVDRSYSAGRAFLNLPDLTGHLQVWCKLRPDNLHCALLAVCQLFAVPFVCICNSLSSNLRLLTSICDMHL